MTLLYKFNEIFWYRSRNIPNSWVKVSVWTSSGFSFGNQCRHFGPAVDFNPESEKRDYWNIEFNYRYLRVEAKGRSEVGTGKLARNVKKKFFVEENSHHEHCWIIMDCCIATCRAANTQCKNCHSWCETNYTDLVKTITNIMYARCIELLKISNSNSPKWVKVCKID